MFSKQLLDTHTHYRFVEAIPCWRILPITMYPQQMHPLLRDQGEYFFVSAFYAATSDLGPFFISVTSVC